MTGQSDELTQLLNSWSNGDDQALDKLIPVVYAELRKLARRHMGRENSDHTLQTSALINEAYLKLVDQQSVQWQNRAHFFAVAAQVMRHILIDHARAHRFAKRGAGAVKVSLDEYQYIFGAQPDRERKDDGQHPAYPHPEPLCPAGGRCVSTGAGHFGYGDDGRLVRCGVDTRWAHCLLISLQRQAPIGRTTATFSSW